MISIIFGLVFIAVGLFLTAILIFILFPNIALKIIDDNDKQEYLNNVDRINMSTLRPIGLGLLSFLVIFFLVLGIYLLKA